jgi:hypothetical protein
LAGGRVSKAINSVVEARALALVESEAVSALLGISDSSVAVANSIVVNISASALLNT